MGFFDKLDDEKKSTARSGRDTVGLYWQKITGIEEFVTQKKNDALKIYKTTVRTIEGETQPGAATGQVIVCSGNYVEDDVRKLYCGASGVPLTEANDTPFNVISERLQSLVGVVVEVKVTERPYTDQAGETKTHVNSYVNKPITPAQLKEAGIDASKFH